MSLTLTQARDAVVSLVRTAWIAGPSSAAIPLAFDNVKFDKPGEDGSTTEAGPWAKITTRIISAGSETQGNRRFTTEGVLTVQIFTPTGDGNTLGDVLSQFVLDTLRAHVGTASGVWFFDATPNEIGLEGPWFQHNVTASFRYQEIV